MKTRSRPLAWLPALLLGTVLALCSAAAQAEAPAEATKALHLLDYIGADYPPTVSDGKVIDNGEYDDNANTNNNIEITNDNATTTSHNTNT